MAVSQRTTQGMWAAISVVLACLTVAACPGRDWTPPTSPSVDPPVPLLTVVVRGFVQDWLGAPIDGAEVTATTGYLGSGLATSTTGPDGRFDLGSFDATLRELTLHVTKSGYLRQTVHSGLKSAVISLIVRLPPLDSLPINGSITQDLLPTDPGDYEADEYFLNTRYYAYSAQDDEVVVDLEWDHTAAPALKMSTWTLIGEFVSQSSGTHEVLRLPRGQSSFLRVGTPYESRRLTAPVRFTLTVK